MKRKFSRRLADALDGVRMAVELERNMRFHLACAGAVLLAGWLLQVGPVKMAGLVLAIALVLVAETVNTALEGLVDLVSPAYHPLARRVKHLAAGVVLLAALASVAMGLLVFWHPLLQWVRQFILR